MARREAPLASAEALVVTTWSACVRRYREADNATVAAAKLGENG